MYVDRGGIYGAHIQERAVLLFVKLLTFCQKCEKDGPSLRELFT
jgi:hypothetical protein